MSARPFVTLARAARPGGVALLAGKQPAAQIAALWYVRGRGALPLPDDFVARIRNQYCAAIISDESVFETEPALTNLLLTYCLPAETLDQDLAPPAPLGMLVRPPLLYRPRVTH